LEIPKTSSEEVLGKKVFLIPFLFPENDADTFKFCQQHVTIIVMGEKQGKVLLEHVVLQKTRAQGLADVRAVNIWGFELEDVSIVGRLPNVETLAFPVNNISTLSAFAHCHNLKNLLLRDNNISDISEIDYLQPLKYLTNLSLSNNPITQASNYRDIVIRKLPQLRKLDDIDCSVRIPRRGENSNIGQSFSTDCQFDTFQQQQPLRQGLPKKSENRAGARRQFNLVSAIQGSHDSEMAAGSKYGKHQRDRRPGNPGDDSNMLAAVLSLLPELSMDSLQTVLEAIQARCSD
jgi:hypothetical protein